MAIFQWQAATSGIRIDVYDDSGYHYYCDQETCNQLAVWQIRHIDIYDGYWRQTCDIHVTWALIGVIEYARLYLAGMGEPSWKK